MMKTYCRVCGDSASAYVCDPCVDRWGTFLRRAEQLLPDILEEVAKTAVKGKAEGGSGGQSEAVSLSALEARDKLQKSVNATCRQVGVTSLVVARERLHVVQVSPLDEKSLSVNYNALEAAVIECVSLVDVREAPIGVGLCACGYTVYAPPSAVAARCRQCGAREPVAVFAERRRVNALARTVGRRLSRSEAGAYIHAALRGSKPGTVKQWFARYLKADAENLYPESELREFVETRVKKYAGPLA